MNMKREEKRRVGVIARARMKEKKKRSRTKKIKERLEYMVTESTIESSLE